jgi:hypothetical protein
VRTIYFNPQDEDTSTTVLFLYNTGSMSAAVQIESFTRTGSSVLDTTIQVPAHELVRVCGDLVFSLSSTWFFDVEFVDFGPSSASAQMTLPPGVKADGYVVWNDGSIYDPLMVAPTLGLRFSSEVDSASGTTPGGPPPTPSSGTIEDFESQDFGPLPWRHSGPEHWFVTSNEAHTGNYCAQAGPIAHDELSILKVIVNCAAGEIRFHVKTSSQWMYDCLKFKIDGDQVEEWSGEMDWTEVSFPVERGSHEFEWRYYKDGSSDQGSDTVWIDDIIFPTD